VGGNVTRGPSFRFTTTFLGQANHPVLRSTARPGDEVWLIGHVGLAGCGLAWLSRGRLPRGSKERRAIDRCIKAWREPKARLREGVGLDGRRCAAIDVSDGLAADCRTLAAESGVKIVLEEAALRAALHPALLAAASAFGRDALDFALRGGEDYALLVAGASRHRPRGSRSIGCVVRGSGGELRGATGTRFLGGGHDHLARRENR
jgi:thiamine-monophosphate kinase